jgi:hypothetical protein
LRLRSSSIISVSASLGSRRRPAARTGIVARRSEGRCQVRRDPRG